MEKTDEEIRKFLSLIPDPDRDIGAGKIAYLYFKKQKLNKEFIEKVSTLLTMDEENELNKLYQLDLMKGK